MSKFTAKNAVVWVWSEFFPPGTCDEAPSKLQEYFDNGYVVKDVHTTTYRHNKEKGDGAPAPVYLFILEKENSKQMSTIPIKYKTS